MSSTKILRFEGNSKIALMFRFIERVPDNDNPIKYYNIEILHDTVALGGKVETLRKIPLVPKTQVIEEVTKFLEDQ